MVSRFLAVAGAALALVTGGSSTAGPYEFELLNVPGGTNSYATGIANDGTIIALNSQDSYLRTPNGTYSQLDFPGRIYTTALGINNAGVIVGDVYDLHTQTYIGFIRAADGTYSDFRYPGVVGPVDGQQANDINDTGVIVGGGASTFGRGAYIRTPDGTFEVFQYDGDPQTIAYGINNTDYISGQSRACQCGFVRAPDGTFTRIAYPGAEDTQPFGINNLGQVVGVWWRADSGVHGFLREPDGTFTTIDYQGPTAGFPEPVQTLLWSINDQGVIVGHLDLGHSLARIALVVRPVLIGVESRSWADVKQLYRR